MVAPIVRDMVIPALVGVDDLLDQMGYSRCREQYAQWCAWLRSNIMGKALCFMMEWGVLPRPPVPTPPTCAFIAWKGELPLMARGIKYH